MSCCGRSLFYAGVYAVDAADIPRLRVLCAACGTRWRVEGRSIHGARFVREEAR